MTHQPHTPIVISFSPNYFVPASVCILSILEHSNEEDIFQIICLVTEPLDEKQQNKLKRISPKRLRFFFINLQGKLNDIYIDLKYTVAASYRLLLPELLKSYDKVIYVDCDVIVRNNLAKLFRETDLGCNYLAAVFEATLDFQIPHVKEVGCEPGEYFNSGFLIMNLDLLRQDDMVMRFIEESKNDTMEFPDQDVLNKLCRGRVLALSPNHNSIRTFYLPQYKKDFLKYYTEDDWNDVQAHGTIHYTGAKPWNSFTVQFATWWKYYEKLSEEIKNEWSVKKRIRVLGSLGGTKIGDMLLGHGLRFYRKVKYKTG